MKTGMKRMLHCTIQLPVNDNTGRPIPKDKLATAVKEASEYAGGCFVHAAGDGHWVPPWGGLQGER